MKRLREGAAAVTAMVLLSNTAPLTGPMSPVIVYDFTQRFHIVPRHAAALVSAELGGLTAATIVAYWLVARFDRRLLGGLALLVAIVGQLATFTTSSFLFLLLARTVAGFGAGLAYSVAIAAISGTAEADRNFSFSIASNAIVTTLLLALTAFFTFGVHAGRVMVAFILLFLLTSLCLPWLPRRAGAIEAEAVRQAGRGHFSLGSALVGLLGMFLLSTSYGAVWPSIGEIGLQRGDSPHTVATAFALVGFGGIAAGLVAAWCSGRLPRALSMAIGALGFAGAVFALTLPLSFALIAVTATFFWAFGIPFYFGTMASLDPTGRLTVLTTAMIPFGMAAGQLITAALTALPGFAWIVGAAIVLAAAGLLALLAALHVSARMRRQVSVA